MGIGGNNPLPFQVGGSPTRLEAMHKTYRQMMGVNGYNADDSSIESEWRRCKSLGLVALESFDERAMLQYFPQTATDHLPLWEEMLGLETDLSLSDEERRQLIIPEYIGVPESFWTALNSQLAEIDERISVTLRTWEQSSTTQTGRLFEEDPPDLDHQYDPLGTRTTTEFPHWSTVYCADVLFDIGGGVSPSRDVLNKTSQIESLLNKILPSWVTFKIAYARNGFHVGVSRLGYTALGS